MNPPSEISEEDGRYVNELRQLVKDDLTDFYDTDFNLLRWLQGYEYDMEKAAGMLRQHLQFRKLLDLDRPIEQLYVHPAMKNYPGYTYHHTTTANNSLLLCAMLEGRCDVPGNLHTISGSDYILTRLSFAEAYQRSIVKAEEKTGRQHQSVVIMDYQGSQINRWSIAGLMGTHRYVTKMVTENYAETTARIFVINAGRVLSIGWKIISPFVSARTKQKIIFLGTDWRTKLKEEIDEDRLPQFWGGTAPNEFDLSYDKIEIPRSMYYDPSEEPSDLISLHLRSGECKIISTWCEETDSKWRWLVKSNGHYKISMWFTSESIQTDFIKINLQDLTTNAELLFPEMQWISNYMPDIGKRTCRKQGWYHIQLIGDSWLFSIKLNLKITMETP